MGRLAMARVPPGPWPCRYKLLGLLTAINLPSIHVGPAWNEWRGEVRDRAQFPGESRQGNEGSHGGETLSPNAALKSSPLAGSERKGAI